MDEEEVLVVSPCICIPKYTYENPLLTMITGMGGCITLLAN